jgi:hypothetical protein
MSKQMTQWLCKNDHILGFIQWNDDDLPQLMVLRKALDMQAEKPNEVDLLGPLLGEMPVRCSICDEVKMWQISVKTMAAILMKLDEVKMLELSQKLLELNTKNFETIYEKGNGGK